MPGIPVTSQIPRLTNEQYDNTVRDLLWIDIQPSSMLNPDFAGPLDASSLEAYQLAARTVAEKFIADESARGKALPCFEETPECVQAIIRDFGLRAFRRPLTEEERSRFQQQYDDRALFSASGSFEDAIQLMVETFLNSPWFLTRAEMSTTPEGLAFALDGFELASRLSYLFWNSMPDEALFLAASAGELVTREQLLLQAERLLADERAREMVTGFHRHYMGRTEPSRWEGYSRDPEQHPGWSDDLIPLLGEETDRIFDHVVFDQQGSFQDLLLTGTAFVNSSTAPLYGLDPAAFGDELTEVELDPTLRPGVFTRAGFLAAHAFFDRTNPISRGVFLETRVIGIDPGVPDHAALVTPLPDDPTLRTTRERVEAQTSPRECAPCHAQLLDPPGFVLEGFDAVGAARSEEDGAPIDTAATVMFGSHSVDVATPFELMAQIAQDPGAQRRYAEALVSQAYDRLPNPDDACLVEQLAERIAQESTILGLLAALTQADSFRLRSTENVPGSSNPRPSSPTPGSPEPITDVVIPGGPALDPGAIPTDPSAENPASDPLDVSADAGVNPAQRDASDDGLPNLGSSGGCGCRVPGAAQRSSPTPSLALLVLLAVGALRRRRNRDPQR